jgi:hypothetical protein
LTRSGNFDKFTVFVGCGSLKVTDGPQEYKSIKMIIDKINFSCFMFLIFNIDIVFKMPYNGWELKEVGGFYLVAFADKDFSFTTNVSANFF